MAERTRDTKHEGKRVRRRERSLLALRFRFVVLSFKPFQDLRLFWISCLLRSICIPAHQEKRRTKMLARASVLSACYSDSFRPLIYASLCVDSALEVLPFFCLFRLASRPVALLTATMLDQKTQSQSVTNLLTTSSLPSNIEHVSVFTQ